MLHVIVVTCLTILHFIKNGNSGNSRPKRVILVPVLQNMCSLLAFYVSQPQHCARYIFQILCSISMRYEVK